MSTVTEITTPRNTAKAFYAHLFDEAGALVRVNGILTFVGDDGTIVEVEPSMINFLTVLGAMTLADAQRLDDLVQGGAAAIACSRDEGVA